jgi:hypothetical protein
VAGGQAERSGWGPWPTGSSQRASDYQRGTKSQATRQPRTRALMGVISHRTSAPQISQQSQRCSPARVASWRGPSFNCGNSSATSCTGVSPSGRWEYRLRHALEWLPSGQFRVLLPGKNPGGDKEIARVIRNLLGHRFDAVAPVLRDEAFDPLTVIAIKDQVFRASDK